MMSLIFRTHSVPARSVCDTLHVLEDARILPKASVTDFFLAAPIRSLVHLDGDVRHSGNVGSRQEEADVDVVNGRSRL